MSVSSFDMTESSENNADVSALVPRILLSDTTVRNNSPKSSGCYLNNTFSSTSKIVRNSPTIPFVVRGSPTKPIIKGNKRNYASPTKGKVIAKDYLSVLLEVIIPIRERV